MLIAFGLNLLIEKVLETRATVSLIFVFAVFIISLKTTRHIWGILAALISVYIDICVFTYPYYVFSVYWSENIITTLVMFAVSIITNTFTVKLKNHQKMLRETEKEKMRANLLRAISHDLRTPLTSIYGSSSTVMENYDSLGKEKQLKLIKEINEDSVWLIRMVENLLSVTRINDKGVKIKKIPVVLEEMMDVILAKFQQKYPSVNIEASLPDEFISLLADPLLIEQVIINLLENSVFHAKGMTVLNITVTEKAKTVEITISDDGCGIPKELLGKVFTGYIEGNDSPADGSRNNMGIGLSICSAIVKAHGSTLHAKNLKSGGASFSFELEKEM